MPYDDDPEDDLAGSGLPLPPDDRLWRHPSELHLAAPTAAGVLAAPARPRSVWPLAAASGLAGAAVAVAAVALFTDGMRLVEREVVTQVAVTQADVALASGGSTGVAAIAERVAPAVVHIAAGGATTGCGVLIRDDGYLLTSASVVGGSDAVTVVTADGERRTGDVVGTDADTDVAVVHVDGDDLPTVVLGTASGLRVGQTAVAVGGTSVTTGVVSAVGQRVERPDGPALQGMIAVDAPATAGGAGGALVDSSGALIGITAASAGGMGYATPVDVAREVADDIIRTGRAEHVWMGVEGTDGDAGALLTGVVDGSPADQAGLRDGDVVVAVDGRVVTAMAALVSAVRLHDPGDEVELSYERDGRRHTTTVTLAEKPAG